LKRGAPDLRRLDTVVQRLARTGELESGEVDGEIYFWPAELRRSKSLDVAPEVRFLAPFDPLVWDRRRFEHFWGWSYRFEGYTPAARRQRGYYAMPMLWRDDVIGWINLSMTDGRLEFDVGYAKRTSRGRDFRRSFEAELERMATFLLHGKETEGA